MSGVSRATARIENLGVDHADEHLFSTSYAEAAPANAPALELRVRSPQETATLLVS
jgi:hypothetical protein